MRAARRSVIGGGAVVDRGRLLAIIAALRQAIPTNIRQARAIIERGEQAIAEAEAQAARIVAEAEREAAQRVSQAAVTRAAEERARQLELEAQERARRTLAAAQAEAERLLAEATARAHAQEEEADRYALAVLNGIEQRLQALLDAVRAAKAQFDDTTR